MKNANNFNVGTRSVRVHENRELDPEMDLDLALERELNYIYSINKESDILSMTITPRFENNNPLPIEYWVVYTYKY